MCRINKHHWCVIFVVCLVAASTGCRNRCACPGGSPFTPLVGSTTVAPPQTYSLNIPGGVNPNYYNGGATTQQIPLQQATNTLPGQNGVNAQNGWRAAGASNSPTPINSNSNGASTSVLENRNSTIANRSQVVSVTPQNRNIVDNRVAQNTNSNGLSFTDSTNFRTTAVDERLDQSRLPVTDASQVRAPTSFSPTTTVGQFNAPYYLPNQQQPVRNFAPQYQNTQQRFANNPQFPNQQQYVNPNLAANPTNTIIGRIGQPTFSRPSPQIYNGLVTQNPQVLAQSTVYADPNNDPNFKNGWRDRDLTAARDSLNR